MNSTNGQGSADTVPDTSPPDAAAREPAGEARGSATRPTGSPPTVADSSPVPLPGDDPPIATDADAPATEGTSATARTRAPWIRLVTVGVVLVLLGAGAGLGVGALLPKEYAARADVLYLLTREQPTGFLREDRNITTQLVMVQSRSVLEPVAVEFGTSVEELTAAVSAEVVDQSEVLRIEVRDGDPVFAQNVLTAIVDGYLEVSNNDPRSELHDYLDGQLIDVLGRLGELGPSGAARQAERAALVDREQDLRSRLDDLAVTDVAGPAARVLVPPYVTTDPVSPRPLVTAATGALAGLIVAAIAVAVAARRLIRS